VEQFTILSWDNRALLEVAPAILNLVHDPPITPELREEVNAIEPIAIIPPYAFDDWKFIVRSAVTVRGHFPEQRIMVALPGSHHMEVRRYLSSLQADGFDAFALPELMGGVPVSHMAGFWESSQILSNGVWYHIAGATEAGRVPVADVKGFWSWSLEGL